MSVLVHCLLTILQSTANFAQVFPSISFAPAANYSNTPRRSPTGSDFYSSYACGLGLAAFFAAGAFFSSSMTTPATL
jgi:hypothetical protein